MSKVKEQNKDFYKNLYEEKLQLQSQRFKYVLSKLSFISGLFGVGIIKFEELVLVELFLIIPVLCVIYDFYIYGADHAVKRMGNFLMNSKDTSQATKDWHKKAASFNISSAFIANHLMTVLVTISSMILYLYKYKGKRNNIIFALSWFGILLFLEIIFYFYQKKQVQTALQN